ncbi:MAG: PEP-CTERM sorting domain-containing protein, partial [Planctomycetales bacterium]
GFVTANNLDTNYAGGTNFRHGGSGVGDDANLLFPGDDRVFHVNLTAVPEPSTWLMATLAVAGVLGRRGWRKRRG